MPVYSINPNPVYIQDKIKDEINSVIESGSFVSGNKVRAFEDAFAAYCGKSYTVCVNSGTSALHLALLISGIGEGDEVITVPNTFVATAEAISYTGAKPVFVDIDINTYNIDTKKIVAVITAKTKAILPVHLFGQPANMARICEIAEKHRLKIIEDCCQAHGATYGGKKVPYSGTGCFSFYPSKNLGAFGEGGAIVTDNKEIAEKARSLRDHGQTKKGVHEYIGFNYRMDEFQGVVLGIKLKHLRKWNFRRKVIAIEYNRLLEDIVITPEVFHVNHQYIIRTPRRDELLAHLRSKDITVGIHYPIPIHLQDAYDGKEGDFPVAEEVAGSMISLPIQPEMTMAQVAFVAEAIKDFLS